MLARTSLVQNSGATLRKHKSLMFSRLLARSLLAVPVNFSADVAPHEANLKASFEHARNLMKAKDIDEVMKLQSEFMRKQFGTVTEQFQRMTGGTASAANDALSEKPETI